ncbi:MAG: TetR/AcrR family transcriptional regulator [Candidatus Bipolaricaulia bacterium]
MSESEDANKEKMELLFKAATKRFGEDGYSDSTMDSIAEEAGVSKGTLYYYFDSKEELFFELLRDWLEKFDRYLDDLTDQSSPVEELTEFHRTMISTVEETASLGKLMLEFWANASRKKKLEELLSDMLSKYRRRTARLIEKGIEEGTFRQVDPWEASSALVAAYDGLWFHWLLDPDSFQLDRAGRELITNFIRGLGKEDYRFELKGGDD